MRRGEIYRVRRPGNDPKASRSFVIVSRQVLLESRFSTATCAPVFSHGEGLASQVPVGTEEGFRHASWIMCDNLVNLRKADLTDYAGTLSPAKMVLLNRALRAALDLA